MSIITPDTPAPPFSLARADGESFTERDLEGHDRPRLLSVRLQPGLHRAATAV